jgi:hypothetical protein
MATADGAGDRRGTVTVHGASSVTAAVAAEARTDHRARRDPDALVAEIERRRQNLAATIDSLAGRVSPATSIRRLREQAQQQLARPELRLAAAAAGLALAGFAVLKIWGRRR